MRGVINKAANNFEAFTSLWGKFVNYVATSNSNFTVYTNNLYFVKKKFEIFEI